MGFFWLWICLVFEFLPVDLMGFKMKTFFSLQTFSEVQQHTEKENTFTHPGYIDVENGALFLHT